MVEKLNQTNFFDEQISDEKVTYTFSWKWGFFSFVAVFFVLLLFFNSYLQRKVLINRIKKQVAYSIEALNQFGWDFAYDNVTFNAFPLLPLGEFNNAKIYNRHAHSSWNVEKVRFDNSILSPQQINFDFSGKQFLTYKGQVKKIAYENFELFSEFEDDGSLHTLSLKMLKFSIADWFDAEKIIFLGQHLHSANNDAQSPYFKSAIEISDIKLNGLLNYPLSQNIRKIYINSDIIGKINFTDSFRSNLREWMSKDGHIQINDLNISWSPLLLVGKGSLYLNENFSPILQLNTTSKALSVLIDDLEKQNWLDSKGIFVAKILLASKSYKSDDNDEYLTVTTPISLRDDALLIEKIAVKKFN